MFNKLSAMNRIHFDFFAGELRQVLINIRKHVLEGVGSDENALDLRGGGGGGGQSSP